MRWYVSIAGNTQGPFEEAALVDMLRRGELAGASHVAAENSQAWVALESHPPFKSALSGPAPAPAPMPVIGGQKIAATMAMDAGAFAEALSQAGMTKSPVAGMQPGVPQAYGGSQAGYTPPAGASQAGYVPPASQAGYSPAPGASQANYGAPAQGAYAPPGGGYQPAPYPQAGGYPGSQPGAHPGSYPGVAPGPGAQPGFNQAPAPAGGGNKTVMIVVGLGCGLLLLITLCGVLGVVARSM